MMMSPLSATSTTGTGSMFDSQPSLTQYSQPSSRSYATGSSATFHSRKRRCEQRPCVCMIALFNAIFGHDQSERSSSTSLFLAVSRRDMSKSLDFSKRGNFEGGYANFAQYK